MEAMLAAAASVAVSKDVSIQIRRHFLTSISKVPGLTFENNLDGSTPPLHFEFINQCIVDDTAAPYAFDRPASNLVDSFNQMSSHAKYYKRGFLQTPTRLRSEILDGSTIIYECGPDSHCQDTCVGRLVQHGRDPARTPLVIFKTQSCGWGVYCKEDLIKGEFVERYCGEIVSADEAQRRKSKDNSRAESFWDLDHFEGENNGPLAGQSLEIDASRKCSIARFINHSCDPWLRAFSTLYRKDSLWLYDIALFAAHDVPKGTELTIDYLGRPPQEHRGELAEKLKLARESVQEDPRQKHNLCHCRSWNCRGYLWPISPENVVHGPACHLEA